MHKYNWIYSRRYIELSAMEMCRPVYGLSVCIKATTKLSFTIVLPSFLAFLFLSVSGQDKKNLFVPNSAQSKGTIEMSFLGSGSDNHIMVIIYSK